MTWLTRLANKIRNFRWPWLSRFLGRLQSGVIIPAAKAVGQAGIDYIRIRIMEESQMNISGIDKLRNVYLTCREHFSLESIGNDFLNNLIQNNVSDMKESGTIK